MRTSNPTTKYEFMVDLIKSADDGSSSLLERLFSENPDNKRSFQAILRKKATRETEILDSLWAFKKITAAVGEYILSYYAPASTKQQLYKALYTLCENIAKLCNIDNYEHYLAILPEPVSEDITISLIKALHDRKGITKEDFARLHTVDPRTVQNRIQALDGNQKHKPLRIGGHSAHVPVAHFKESSHRDELQRYYTPNTMNPLVLQLNTIQVATLLQSLHYNRQKGNYIPLDLAIDIWSQLSSYTRSRVQEVFCRNDPDFAEFLKDIDAEAFSLCHHFMSEHEILEERDTSEEEMILIAHKGNLVCDIDLISPLRSRSHQRILYDYDQNSYYAVSADNLNGERLYFTKEELDKIRECL